MFKVTIRLSPFSLVGLAALDERRRLKLPDDSWLSPANSRDEIEVSADVSEGFARMYFSRTDRHIMRHVTQHLLTPGDVAVTGVGYLRWSTGITPERVRELWLGVHVGGHDGGGADPAALPDE